ncbi:hypothetical protein IMSAGC019_00489 [Lachnospiraceae bacterium]|nr:hypothetical protein IMSAGC019_00489 [Lachnospiraceae bacterium]
MWDGYVKCWQNFPSRKQRFKECKSLRGIPEALHSYEGGDSELFNYLEYYHKGKMCIKCVRFMRKI